jgi:hypothetical protein
MDMSSVAQLMNGVNASNNQQNSAPTPIIPGTQPMVPISGTLDTDFGAAGVYEPTQASAQSNNFEVDMNRVRELWSDHEARVESFRRMVETLLGQQAERQGLAQGWSIRDIEITDEMRAEAQEMIDEGGYFSVEETASRILDFAVAISGGDPARIEVLRNAVQRGFDQAERMFGGELPEITHQTHAAVMEGFDQWAEAGSASAIALLNR